MTIEVKLYFFHDLDLCTLFRSNEVAFPETTREILNAYEEKRFFRVRLLNEEREMVNRHPSQGYKKFFRYRVMLDPQKDRSAITLLKRINDGYRNNFIKVILRQYLCAELPGEYLMNGDRSYFKERSAILQGNREDVRITAKKRRAPKNHQIKQQAGELKKPQNTGIVSSLEVENISKEKAVAYASKNNPQNTEKTIVKPTFQAGKNDKMQYQGYKTSGKPKVQTSEDFYSLERDLDDFMASAIDVY